MAYMWNDRYDSDYWDFDHKMEVWYVAYDGRWKFVGYCYGDLEAMDWEDDDYTVIECEDC